MLDAVTRYWGKAPETVEEVSRDFTGVRGSEKISDISQLAYSVRGTLTAALGFVSNDLSNIAILDFGNKEIGIYTAQSFVASTLHVKARARVFEKNYKIVDERIADVHAIVRMNNALSNTENINLNSDASSLCDELFVDAVEKRTTDIHLCAREHSAALLFRINKALEHQRKMDPASAEKISSYIYQHWADDSSRGKDNGGYSPTKKELHCAFERTMPDGRVFRMRYKRIKVYDGFDLVIRLQDISDQGVMTFKELGYQESQEAIFAEAIEKTNGLIVFSGKTNSGKTRSIKTCCEFDRKQSIFMKRYTIEDPVEVKIYGWSQISIQRDDHDNDTSADWAGVLRDLLRADPDQIMVGEVRDEETAALVTDFVYTGHKCLTTIHAPGGFGVIIRLSQLGVPNYILSEPSFLVCTTYQRLMPVLCNHCKVLSKTVIDERKQQLLTSKFKLDLDGIYSKNPEGCEHCNHTGTRGLTVVAEVIEPDDEMRRCIADGRFVEAEQHYRSKRTTGFDDPDMTGKTIYEHALYKCSQGQMDPEVIERDLNSRLERYHVYEVNQ
jgi:type II secretory ATPase GspE/PulE/Tfp pilus assembly ATPase PilB-like protein